jgi:hypothetical protein
VKLMADRRQQHPLQATLTVIKKNPTLSIQDERLV